MKSVSVVITDTAGNPALRLYIQETGHTSLSRDQLSDADKAALREVAEVLNQLAGAKPADGMHRRGSATR